MINNDYDLKKAERKLEILENENRAFVAPNIGCSMSLATVFVLIFFMFSQGTSAYNFLAFFLLILFIFGASLLIYNYTLNRKTYQANKKEIQRLKGEIENYQNEKRNS